MSSAFFNKSKKIANDFIQSIVFLDDRAYTRDNHHGQGNINDLHAPEISKIFAREEKICAVYDPETLNDISDCKQIATKSDIIILDWFIDIREEIEGGDEEDDAEEDDVRGKYTLDIISSLIDPDNYDRLKIILVYTGEIDLVDISEKIRDLNPALSLDTDELRLQIGKTIIFVRAKSNNQEGIDNRFAHLPSLNDKVLKYRDLPGFLLEEFTKITSGLLTNFALLSITSLRNNTSKVLGLFSNDLDPAYLGHKSLIPKQEDAEDLLIELFGDSIKDLLYYSGINIKLGKDINDWIDSNVIAEKFEHNKKKYDKDLVAIKGLLSSKEEDAKKRFSSLLTGAHGEVKNHLLDNPIKIFTNNSNLKNVENQNKNFAKLTHHKSLFIPKEIEPKLTLGSLIKSTKGDKYYICIQQKCDSVRISKGTERKFLFLPLSVVSDDNKGKFDLITNSDIELRKDKNSYSIRTIKFCSNNDLGIIKAVKNEQGKYIFKQKYTEATDEQFEWILDLKDLHAQRIVIDYTNSLSRVGLDESEWLRKAGTK